MYSLNYIKNMRIIEQNIKKDFFSGRAIILVGPRQVGKTTLSEKIVSEFESDNKKIIRINCDNPTDKSLLEDRNLNFLQNVVGDADIIFIDEGQRVKTIGQSIKLLVDFYKSKKQIIVTGSSSFNLLNQTTEPLTGRKYVYHLYPLSITELISENDALYPYRELETLLRFGSYPSVINAGNFAEKQRVLLELSSSQLYKDILEFQILKDSTVLTNLLKALALQVGSQVSYTKLASLVGVDKNTVERYIDLLEKSFIVFRLVPFYTNKRNEIRKMKKIYFYDVGIRNALINNFNEMSIRNDVGALWENFLITERIKNNQYKRNNTLSYFWRTWDKKEIDLVEERDGKLFGYEFKWGGKTPKVPKNWIETYDNAEYKVINQENYLEFVVS